MCVDKDGSALVPSLPIELKARPLVASITPIKCAQVALVLLSLRIYWQKAPCPSTAIFGDENKDRHQTVMISFANASWPKVFG